jgi:hypothetical protein
VYEQPVITDTKNADKINSCSLSGAMRGVGIKFWNYFIVLIPVYLQLTERGHIGSTPPPPNYSATDGNIFGIPVVE